MIFYSTEELFFETVLGNSDYEGNFFTETKLNENVDSFNGEIWDDTSSTKNNFSQVIAGEA